MSAQKGAINSLFLTSQRGRTLVHFLISFSYHLAVPFQIKRIPFQNCLSNSKTGYMVVLRSSRPASRLLVVYSFLFSSFSRATKWELQGTLLRALFHSFHLVVQQQDLLFTDELEERANSSEAPFLFLTHLFMSEAKHFCETDARKNLIF